MTYGDYLPPGRARPPSSIRVKCRRGRGCRGAGLLARGPGWLSVRICPGQKETSSVHGYHWGTWECRSTQSLEQVTLASSKGRCWWLRHYCSERKASTTTHSSNASSGSQEPDKRPPGCSPSTCKSKAEPAAAGQQGCTGWRELEGMWGWPSGKAATGVQTTVSCNK